MEMNKSTHNQNTLLGLCGEVDLHSSGKLRDALLDIIKQDKPVLVDFSQLEYIDSSGVAALVETYNEAKKRSVDFTIVGATGGPLQVLELTRLVSVFPMVQSLEEV